MDLLHLNWNVMPLIDPSTKLRVEMQDQKLAINKKFTRETYLNKGENASKLSSRSSDPTVEKVAMNILDEINSLCSQGEYILVTQVPIKLLDKVAKFYSSKGYIVAKRLRSAAGYESNLIISWLGSKSYRKRVFGVTDDKCCKKIYEYLNNKIHEEFDNSSFEWINPRGVKQGEAYQKCEKQFLQIFNKMKW